MLNENYNDPSASGFKDAEGNGISHPKNRQDIRVSNIGTTSISLPIVSEWEEDCMPAIEAKNLNSEIVDLKTKLLDILNAKEQDVDFCAREAYPTLSIVNWNGDTVGYDNHDKEREIYKKGYRAALSNIHFVLNH